MVEAMLRSPMERFDLFIKEKMRDADDYIRKSKTIVQNKKVI